MAAALRNDWSVDRAAQTSEIQRSLQRLAEAAWAIETNRFEVPPWARIRAELIPTLRAVMSDAIALLGDVLIRYETFVGVEGANSSGVFNCVFDDLVDDNTCPTNPHQRIADAAFMARWEIERKQATITEAMRGDDARLLAECCSARRRVIKAASGVERVLSEVEGVASVLQSLFQTERQHAIETRLQYHAFADGVRRAVARWQGVDLERCLRSIGTIMAKLLGRPICEELRIEDRRSLRSLQVRLVDWLCKPHDSLEGRRLVSEVLAFTGLLMEVNQRAVLIEHDCKVLDKLIAAMAQPGTQQDVFFQLLSTLLGRDPDLDDLIVSHTELRPELWQEVAHRTLARLRQQVQPTRLVP